MESAPYHTLSRQIAVTVVVLSAVVNCGGCGSKPVNRARGKQTVASPTKQPQNSGGQIPGVEPRSSYLNHSPDVAYVGTAKCQECHAEIAESYATHPMGRSMRKLGPETPPLSFDPAAENEFQVGDFHYSATWNGNQMVQLERKIDDDGETLVEQREVAAYEVGAGEHGRSYFVHRSGSLWMSPMTWYPQKQTWGLSPNYEHENQHFTRPVTKDCLFCHANQIHPVAGSINRYHDPPFTGHAIGCERCHGPGAAHVAKHQGQEVAKDDLAQTDLTIVNPMRLSDEAAADICYQCHLSGAIRVPRLGKSLADFRPGQKLADYVSTLVRRQTPNSPLDETQQITGHVEQMHRSVCYQRSHIASYEGQRMQCTSCHDPHRKPAPADKHRYFRNKCAQCHEDQACSETAERRDATPHLADNCAYCHMPHVPSNVQHAAVTDHAILRRPGKLLPIRGPLPLAEFQAVGLADGEQENSSPRELAIGMMQHAAQHPDQATPEGVGFALVQLQNWVRTKPSDTEAADALAQALFGTGELNKAMGVMVASLDVAPEAESLLGNAAFLALQGRNLATAKELAQRAAQISPGQVRYPMMLGQIAIAQQDWEALQVQADRLEELSPTLVVPYQWRVLRHHALGADAAAEAAFQRLVKLFPQQRESLEAWRSSL